MAAYVCDGCSIAWPYETTYKRGCPVCQCPTDYSLNASAVTGKEAKSLVSHAKFDRFYAKREKAREKRGEASPEQIGSLQAREIAELNRAAGLW